MRAILCAGALALSACHTTHGYVDDGTVQPFGGKNTYAINLIYVNGLGQRGFVDDYLNTANAKCASMSMYMQPEHKSGDLFVFRCTSQTNDPNWRADAGVATVQVK